MYGSATPATSTAIELAKENNSPYGITITTTPSDADTAEGIYTMKVISLALPFKESFYDDSIEDVKAYIDRKSKNTFVYIEFSYRQLGKDAAWLKQQAKVLQYDMALIKREIYLEWNKSSDRKLFSEKEIDGVFVHVEEPIAEFTIQKYYKFNLYSDEFKLYDPVIISVDVASGSEQDNTAITIFDPITFEVYADFRDNKIDTEELKKLLYELVDYYFVNSILVVERNSIGKTVLDYLYKFTNIERKLYYEYKTKEAVKEEYSNLHRTVSKTKKRERIYGVDTSKISRPLMMEDIMYLVRNEPSLLRSKLLYNDIRILERKKNGKIEHADGYSDDNIMSYVLGRHVVNNCDFSKFMSRLRFFNKPKSKASLIDNDDIETIDDESISPLDDMFSPYSQPSTANIYNRIVNNNTNALSIQSGTQNTSSKAIKRSNFYNSFLK